MKLELSGGKSPGHEGYETQEQLVSLFEECLKLQDQRSSFYGEAWRSSGYMGNLGRVLSKVARLKNMMWKDYGEERAAEESTEDTLLDLINLSAFMLLNKRAHNKWGN